MQGCNFCFKNIVFLFIYAPQNFDFSIHIDLSHILQRPYFGFFLGFLQVTLINPTEIWWTKRSECSCSMFEFASKIIFLENFDQNQNISTVWSTRENGTDPYRPNRLMTALFHELIMIQDFQEICAQNPFSIPRCKLGDVQKVSSTNFS